MVGRVERGGIDVAIAAREAQVIGSAPRIEPLQPEDMDEEAMGFIHRLLGSIGATHRDFIPEYFRTMIKHPALFQAALDMGTTLFKGKIPPRERELAVLRIGWLCAAPYEWGEHVDIAQRFGVTKEQVERVTQGSAAEGWSELDRAILRGVEELIGDKAIADDTWQILARYWDEPQLLEFPMLVGQYVSTAFLQNSLRMRLAHDNPGLCYR